LLFSFKKKENWGKLLIGIKKKPLFEKKSKNSGKKNKTTK